MKPHSTIWGPALEKGHHEYVDDVDYRSIVNKFYNEHVFNNDNYAQNVHYELLDEKNNLPVRISAEKNSDANSDIYNYVIGYCKEYPSDLLTRNDSTMENAFEFKILNSSDSFTFATYAIRKAATLYALHQAVEKSGRFNDPATILYDAIKKQYLIIIGQQRFYYSKLVGTPLAAYVYSLGLAAANEIKKDIPNIDFNIDFRSQGLIVNPKMRSFDGVQQIHMAIETSHDNQREHVLEEHMEHVMEFVVHFLSFEEEVYYYNKNNYLFFMPNKDAKNKVKVLVEDVYGVCQHMLWRYCGIEDFKIKRRFTVSEL